MDDERLKEGRSLGTDYFDELLERIREIRASEKRFYQKIRDLYALAIDYDAATSETKEFSQVVHNKLHWAITKRTAAEIIADQASASRPNMGLTTWKGAKVRKADVIPYVDDAGFEASVVRAVTSSIALRDYQKNIVDVVKSSECIVFVDTNVLAWSSRLNDVALRELMHWLDTIAKDSRLVVPAWADPAAM